MARCGEWRLDTYGQSLGARCHSFSLQLSRLCEELEPTTIAIEQPFYDRTHQLHCYYGFACTIAFRLRVELRSFWPQQIKKHAVGWKSRWVDGRKEECRAEHVAAAMRVRWPGLEVGLDSGVALGMLDMLLTPHPIPPRQRKGPATVSWPAHSVRGSKGYRSPP